MKKDTWAAGDLDEPYVGRWSRLVATEFLAWLQVPSDAEWLDVGCGTGALAATILQQAQPRSVKGIDPSAGFLETAKNRVADANASFEVGDAQSLPVGSARFDAVVSGLVLNFVPKPALAVGEMRRAAKPGGAVAAYLWDYAGKMDDGSIALVARAWAVRGSAPA